MSEFQALLDEIERLEKESAAQGAEIDRLDEALNQGEDAEYWQSVYDRLLDAWHKFALAELGTTQPSPVDLQNRPELAELYEAIR
jgi:hypothetical protein